MSAIEPSRGLTSLLVKLAMRCNIACTYCYWFRDPEVFARPPLMGDATRDQLLMRIEDYLRAQQLRSFSLVFHGGEPLLYGVQRFDRLAALLRGVEERTGCEIALSVMTNGLLLNREWLDVLRRRRVRLGVSIDGQAPVHDGRRIDFHGQGTHARVDAAVRLALDAGFEIGVLAVCAPESDPADLFRYLVDDLGVTAFDVLVPDLTHDDHIPSISRFYRRLFDLWYEGYADQGVEVRYLRSLLQGLLGGRSGSIVLGSGPVTSVTVLTDGTLEALDTVRAAGGGVAGGSLNVFTNSLEDIHQDPLWGELLRASLQLPAACRRCRLQTVCGGGPIASRWSVARRFDNPSVYCADIIEIADHVWSRVKADLFVEWEAGGRV